MKNDKEICPQCEQNKKWIVALIHKQKTINKKYQCLVCTTQWNVEEKINNREKFKED